MTFRQDRLENEKNEPTEASSLEFIYVPVVLISMLVGFGISYLALRTQNTSMSPGDSRTVPVAAAAMPAAGRTTGADDLAALMEKGKQVYTTTCQACHQATGAGIPGAFPPLAESEWVNGSPRRMAAIVLHGLQGEITVKGQKYQGAMPPFKDQLKPEDVAAVATYVRGSFGNTSAAVTVDTVKGALEETASRTSPWNGEAELNAGKWE